MEKRENEQILSFLLKLWERTYCMLNEWTFLDWPCDDELRKLENSKPSPYLGFVYIIEWNDIIKIGCTLNPLQRIKNLFGYNKYAGVNFGMIAVSKPHSNYSENENILHKALASKRIKGTELFNISFIEALDILPKIDLELKIQTQEEIDERVDALKRLTGLKSKDEVIRETANDMIERPDYYVHQICTSIDKYYQILDELIDISRSVNEDPYFIKYLQKYPEDHYILQDCF